MNQNVFDEEMERILKGCEEYYDAETVTPVKIDLPENFNGDISDYSIEQLLEEESKSHNSQIQFLIANFYKQEENWDECYYWAKKSALQNNPDGIARLAFMFQFEFPNSSFGCMDFETAYKLYKKAACLGSAIGQSNLGIIIRDNGEIETAIKWYKLAEDQCLETASLNLGYCYFDMEEYENAFQYFKKIEGSDILGADAKLHLGIMYYEGLGVEQDVEEALRLWDSAALLGNHDALMCIRTYEAKAGNADAMYVVGKDYEDNNNHEEAINWYKEAAEKGNINAQYELFKAYNTGWDVPEDDEEAEKWLKKAAKAGQPDAQYKMGEFLYDKNIKRSLDWYKKAADNGHINSLNFLGDYYMDNESEEKALEYWIKAAELGDSEAQNNVSKCYYEGIGVEQDFAEALKWCRLSAEQGDMDGMYNLAWSYDKGTGVKQDYLEAAKWYELSAKEGHRDAPLNLGWLYENGLGVIQSFEKALNWYNFETSNLFSSNGFISSLYNRLKTERIKTEDVISKEQGSELIKFNLQELLTKEKINPDALVEFIISDKYFEEKKFENSYEWIKKSAEKGLASAQYNLGLCYYLALGVRLNNEEAVNWFTLAANKGILKAQLVLNDCYWEGIGVPENREEATKWLGKAAEQGDAFALYSYGNRLLNGYGIEENVTEGGDLITEAAEKGNINAQWDLGNGYDANKHYEEALKFYRMLANLGRKEGQFKLGEYYEFGKGIPKDKEEAKKWYKLAAEQNDEYAQECYERCLYCDWDYDENMESEDELKWKTLAAENGSAIGQCYLGWINDNDCNYEEAVKWYSKAAEQGKSEAIYHLAYFYEYGNGVEADKDKALELYLRAAKQGYAEAMNSLAIFFEYEDDEEAEKWKMLKKEASDNPEVKHIREILRERYIRED